MNSFMIAAERSAEFSFNQRQYKQCIAICTAALDTDESADEIIVWLMRAYSQEGRQAELEHVYRRYAKALRIDAGELVGYQDPVVQAYQHLDRSRIVNNSS